MTGSLAPPPPYGSEQGSILLEAGREGARQGQGGRDYIQAGHGRSRSGQIRPNPPMSPGPQRSPTEISLAQLTHIPSNEDVGEGTSRIAEDGFADQGLRVETHDPQDFSAPPPEYTSPEGSTENSRRSSEGSEGDGEERPLIRGGSPRPPIPSYDAAVANDPRSRDREEL